MRQQSRPQTLPKAAQSDYCRNMWRLRATWPWTQKVAPSAPRAAIRNPLMVTLQFGNSIRLEGLRDASAQQRKNRPSSIRENIETGKTSSYMRVTLRWYAYNRPCSSNQKRRRDRKGNFCACRGVSNPIRVSKREKNAKHGFCTNISIALNSPGLAELEPARPSMMLYALLVNRAAQKETTRKPRRGHMPLRLTEEMATDSNRKCRQHGTNRRHQRRQKIGDLILAVKR